MLHVNACDVFSDSFWSEGRIYGWLDRQSCSTRRGCKKQKVPGKASQLLFDEMSDHLASFDHQFRPCISPPRLFPEQCHSLLVDEEYIYLTPFSFWIAKCSLYNNFSCSWLWLQILFQTVVSLFLTRNHKSDRVSFLFICCGSQEELDFHFSTSKQNHSTASSTPASTFY